MEVNSMQQVLLNLISNALDALMESQKKEIHIEVYREDDFIQLIVTDSGCGLAPENLEKIYDPFYTTKPIGQGTGLGLTTSRSIIESHGGAITCESKLGVGTTFKILLPIKTKGGEK
jgi:two-component system NtrC family sensor kinase